MIENLRYCDQCEDKCKTVVKEKEGSFSFRHEPFTIIYQYAACSVCDSEVYDEMLDSATLDKLGELYLQKHNMQQKEIKEIRQKYGFTQDIFSRILNWGVASIKRYETGTSMPSGTQMNILKMLKIKPETIIDFYNQTKSNFNEEEKKLIENHLKLMFPHFAIPQKIDFNLLISWIDSEKTLLEGEEVSEFCQGKITQLSRLMNAIEKGYFANSQGQEEAVS